MQSEEIVVFDLDGTLFRGNTFHCWLLFLVFSKASGLSIVMRARIVGWALLRMFRLIPHAKLKKDVIFSAVSASSSRVFVDSWIVPGISPVCSAEIERWKRLGASLVLATAAPECYAEIVGERLGFQVTLGSKISADGYFHENSGRLKMQSFLSISKGKNPKAAYSDHVDDLPLISGASLRFVVNPSERNLRQFEANLGSGAFKVLRDY